MYLLSHPFQKNLFIGREIIEVLPESKCWFDHFLAACSWVNYQCFIFLSLDFLICKMEELVVVSLRILSRID